MTLLAYPYVSLHIFGQVLNEKFLTEWGILLRIGSDKVEDGVPGYFREDIGHDGPSGHGRRTAH